MKILLVDDDTLILYSLEADLRKLGHEVFSFQNPWSAIKKGIQEHPELVISDWKLEDSLDGIGVCMAINAVYPDTRLVMMSGCASRDIFDAAGDLPLEAVLHKPIDTPMIAASVPGI